jgi:hypothetical protein
VWLRLHLGEGHLHVPVLAVHRDRALDVAVLEIDDDRRPHPIGDWAEVINLLAEWAIPLDVGVRANQRVRVEGYPAHTRNPDGRGMSGRISDPRARVAGVRAMELFLDELAASAAEKPVGLSGGPVLTASDAGEDLEVAIGVVRAYSKADDGVSAVGGGLYATAVDDIVTRFPAISEAVVDTDVIVLPVVRSAVVRKFLARNAYSLKTFGSDIFIGYSMLASVAVGDQTFVALRVLRLADHDPHRAVSLFAGLGKSYERAWAKVLRKCAQDQPTTTAAILAALSRDHPEKAERLAAHARLVLPRVMP